MPPYRSDRWHGHMPSSAGTLRSVSVLTHLSGGDPAGLVGVSLTICQVGRLGRKKEEGTTLIPILPFVVLGNHWSPGKVTWANPRLGKVTLNRARLHLCQSIAYPRSQRGGSCVAMRTTHSSLSTQSAGGPLCGVGTNSMRAKPCWDPI